MEQQGSADAGGVALHANHHWLVQGHQGMHQHHGGAELAAIPASRVRVEEIADIVAGAPGTAAYNFAYAKKPKLEDFGPDVHTTGKLLYQESQQKVQHDALVEEGEGGGGGGGGGGDGDDGGTDGGTDGGEDASGEH